jgi:hypothetical protein
MDLTFSIVGIVAVILLVAALRRIFAWGWLQGAKEATHELTRGVSTHYEHEGEPIPERVGNYIDEMKARLRKATGTPAKCDVHRAYFWGLGNVTGEAAWHSGFEAGRQFARPQKDEVLVDLSPSELMNLRWLAHFGFENMMRRKDGPFIFKNEKEAVAATHAIERLEFHIQKQERDQSDPYALSFNRQTMIWDRWPSEKRAP